MPPGEHDSTTFNPEHRPYSSNSPPPTFRNNWPAFCWSRDLVDKTRSSQMLQRGQSHQPTGPVRRRPGSHLCPRDDLWAARTAMALGRPRPPTTDLYHNWYWTRHDDDDDDNDDDDDDGADDDEANRAGSLRRRSREAGRSPRCRTRSAAARRWVVPATTGGTAGWPACRRGNMTARDAAAGLVPGRKRRRRTGDQATSKTEERGAEDQCLVAKQL